MERWGLWKAGGGSSEEQGEGQRHTEHRPVLIRLQPQLVPLQLAAIRLSFPAITVFLDPQSNMRVACIWQEVGVGQTQFG